MGKSWFVNIDNYLKAIKYPNSIHQWDYTQLIFCSSICMLEWTPPSWILCRPAQLWQCPPLSPPGISYKCRLNARSWNGFFMSYLFTFLFVFWIVKSFTLFINKHFFYKSPSCSFLLSSKFPLFTLPQK